MFFLIAICFHFLGVILSSYMRFIFYSTYLRKVNKNRFINYIYVFILALYDCRWGWLEVRKQFYSIKDVKPYKDEHYKTNK